MAYEVAAIAGTSVREPALDYPEDGPPIDEQVAVEVWDAELCPRYAATLVTGLTVGPSPRWMQDRLLRAGMRPINNVVDVTNYVMLELGQPLHAFNYHGVKERKVIVRQARPGETLLSLDGAQRKLGPPMLVIADAQDAVGLAGVMGGAHSEVTSSTTAVFLESASFHPFNTRRTAGALRLRTEAALRFEKGLRPELPMVALQRATRLILEVAGGTAAQGVIDVYPERREAAPVTLTSARLRQVLGVDVPAGEAARVLSGLGFRAAASADDALEVAVPYWRADVGIEDDLVEEVARVVGYDRIPTTTMAAPIPPHQPNPLRELKERVRDLFVAAGFQEVVTYSLVGAGALDVKAPGPDPLRVANPLTPEHEYLAHQPPLQPAGDDGVKPPSGRRPPAPLRGLPGVSLLGRGPPPRARDGRRRHDRGHRAGLLAAASRDPWTSSMRRVRWTPFWAVWASWATTSPSKTPRSIPAGRPPCASRGRRSAFWGRSTPRPWRASDVDGGPVVLFELDLEALLEALPAEGRRFRPVPRYPDATRDLALVVPLETSAAQVQAVLERHPLVARVTLFDVYVGPQVEAGRRSLAYRLTLRSPERTLTTAEVERATDELLGTLRREMGATPALGGGRPRRRRWKGTPTGTTTMDACSVSRMRWSAFWSTSRRWRWRRSPCCRPWARPWLRTLSLTSTSRLCPTPAMDGYAVRRSDIMSATPDSPVLLKVVGEVAAGSLPDRPVEPETAVRIMTGAPIPQGADAVVPFEETDEEERKAQGSPLDSIAVRIDVGPGAHVRPAGEDIARGQMVLASGTVLRPADAGVLASLGRDTVRVVRRPRVAVLATGDELMAPGQALAPGKIYDSNSFSVAAAVQHYGGVPYLLGIAPDNLEETLRMLDQGLGSDLVLTSAGVSRGDYDLVKDALRQRGEIDFWSVRMRPAKPLAFGALQAGEGRRVPHIGLPGNPVSALVAFEQFCRPAILLMLGRTELAKPTVSAVLEGPIHNTDGRRVYARVWVTRAERPLHRLSRWPAGEQPAHVCGPGQRTRHMPRGRAPAERRRDGTGFRCFTGPRRCRYDHGTATISRAGEGDRGPRVLVRYRPGLVRAAPGLPGLRRPSSPMPGLPGRSPSLRKERKKPPQGSQERQGGRGLAG